MWAGSVRKKELGEGRAGALWDNDDSEVSTENQEDGHMMP